MTPHASGPLNAPLWPIRQAVGHFAARLAAEDLLYCLARVETTLLTTPPDGAAHTLETGLDGWEPSGEVGRALFAIHLKAFDRDRRLLMRQTYVAPNRPAAVERISGKDSTRSRLRRTAPWELELV